MAKQSRANHEPAELDRDAACWTDGVFDVIESRFPIAPKGNFRLRQAKSRTVQEFGHLRLGRASSAT